MSTVHRIISIALAKFSDCLLLEGGGGECGLYEAMKILNLALMLNIPTPMQLIVYRLQTVLAFALQSAWEA